MDNVLYFFKQDGIGAAGPNILTGAAWPPARVTEAQALAEAQAGEPLIAFLTDADLGPFTGLVATIDTGAVVSVAPPPDPSTLWVHVAVSGGISSPAGTLYLKNDGVDALTVHAELRDGPDAGTSNAVTQIGGQDITAMWALELVNVDTKALADTPLVQMTAGAIDVSYTTTIAPCEVELAEDRLQTIGEYVLKLAQPVRFKVVRALS